MQGPRLYSHYSNTQALHFELADIHNQLKSAGMCAAPPICAKFLCSDALSLSAQKEKAYFLRQTSWSAVEDDRTCCCCCVCVCVSCLLLSAPTDEPFLALGVPIVHLVTTPFPSVWHTPRDDLSAIVPEVVRDLMNVFYEFCLRHIK